MPRRAIGDDVFVRDREALKRPLPAPFDACDKQGTRVNSLSLVRYRTNDYSVPVAYGHQEVWTTSVTSFASGPLPLDETPPLLVMSPPEKSAATRRLRQAGNSRLEEVQFVTAKLLRSIQLSQLNHNAESGFGGNFS